MNYGILAMVWAGGILPAMICTTLADRTGAEAMTRVVLWPLWLLVTLIREARKL